MISILIPKESTLATSSSITLVVTLLLLACLIQKEISGSLEGDRARRLSQALDVALVPLVVAFIVNAVVMIVSSLR